MDPLRRDSHRHGRTVTVSLVTACLLALTAPAAHSRVYVIPHVLEVAGRISAVQYTFDHNLYAFYGSGLAGTPSGTGATINLYLYDATGNPMQNNAQDVCNPCLFSLGPPVAQRKLSINIENLILARGPFNAGSKLGFGIIVVGGDDPAGVSLESDIVNSHTSAFDLSILSGAPTRLRSEDPGAPGASVFQLTHMFETAGTIGNTQFTFDQDIHAVYTAGLAGTPAGPGATLDLYLFDNTGNLPLTNNGLVVCNPCSFALGGANPRKRSILLDQLISAQGGPNFSAKLGSAMLVVTGDAGNVTLDAITSNAHLSGLDLTTTYSPITPVQISELLDVVLEPRPGAVTRLGASPSPSSGGVHFAIEMARAAQVELSIFDVAGRKVATVFEGHMKAGASSYRWDGAGSAGVLQGGVYFARLSSADGSSQARLVMRP